MAACLGAELVSGFDLFASEIGSEGILEGADLLITGEGVFDETSFLGKAAVAATTYARELGIPVWVVCGSEDFGIDHLPMHGIERIIATGPVDEVLLSEKVAAAFRS
jgi:glycerate kinase